MHTTRSLLSAFFPFWVFLMLFKFGGALHYTLLAPFGEQLMPLWLVGLLVGGESLIQMSLDIPAGWLLDRLGYRQLLLCTTLFFVIAAACIAAGLTLATYLLTIFLSIFGWLFFVPGVSAYSLSQADERESGRFFSFRDVSNSIGVVLASASLPFVLLLPVRAAGVILVLLLCGAFLSLLMAPKDKYRLPPPPERTAHQHRHVRRQSLRALWHAVWRLNPASGMLALLTLSAGTFYGVIWFTVPLVIARQQANAGALGLGLGVFDFSVVLLGYGIGRMVDRVDKRAFVFFGLLIFALCGMALGVNFGIFFLLFGFLATAGEEMAGISLWSWLHHLDHEHANDGAVSGVITLFDDLGYAVGPMLAGVLYTLTGPAWAITLGALPILIVWLVYYFVVHERFPLGAVYALTPQMPRRRRHKS